MLIATPMGDDPRTFDELMAKMGVEKLGRKTVKKKPVVQEAPKEPPPKPKPRPKVAKPPTPAPAKKDSSEQELVEARATIEALRTELEEARRPPPTDPSSLQALLETRGIRGTDEARSLLEALAQARLTDTLLGELVVRHPDRIAKVVRD
jgi:outer membrane biosynthesis protein TonB